MSMTAIHKTSLNPLECFNSVKSSYATFKIVYDKCGCVEMTKMKIKRPEMAAW